jgi:argininosuccinate lyase
MDDLVTLREKLEEKKELIEEALYYITALEEHNYINSDDEDKLNEELEKILKDLGIELEYEE